MYIKAIETSLVFLITLTTTLHKKKTLLRMEYLIR